MTAASCDSHIASCDSHIASCDSHIASCDSHIDKNHIVKLEESSRFWNSSCINYLRRLSILKMLD